MFSLAIVLWELVAGRYIVQRGDAVEAMRAIRDGNLEPLAHAAPHVPANSAGRRKVRRSLDRFQDIADHGTVNSREPPETACRARLRESR